MKSLFCSVCRAKNNEEYRAVLKKRQISFCLFVLVGMATEAIVLFLHLCTQITFPEYRLGYLLGLGVGLALSGVVGLVQIRRRMADEEKLKKWRLKETDERELEVDSMALRTAAKMLLAVMYVVLIAAGMFAWKELLWVCWGLIAFFLLSYAICKKYYEVKI
ncbi:MAG: hypothetical protein NC389_10605 [Acetatifactor muris]|nr:hypothetical protein [Acetatifactor muris]